MKTDTKYCTFGARIWHKEQFWLLCGQLWGFVHRVSGTWSYALMSNEYAIVLVCEQTKINVTPIFGVSRINDKFCHCSRGLKIGLALFFLCSHTNRWYVALLHNQIPVWLRNMGSKFPVFHFLHVNPCLRRMHPKLGSVLHRHGFGWQIRNTGSLDPIFHSQTGLGTSSGRGYRLFVPDSIKIIFF